ncbi:hypothetical protein PAPHI01_1954 [Pancytospora philotis]|nr:hypothetical protein PAPHI01_1954 [Pancytospora philotis]
MGQQNSRVGLLLQEILRSPQSPSAAALEQFVATDAGLADLTENLRAGNSLAFIYLKQCVGRWADAGSHAALYSPEFVGFLVSISSKGARYYVCDVVRQLSSRWLIPPALVSRLIADGCYDVLESVTRKYTQAARSNELFLEIKRVIEEMVPVIGQTYFAEGVETAVRQYCRQSEQGAGAAVHVESIRARSPHFFDPSLLGILYNLLYQDLHPFFEDRLEYFFELFYVLFENEATRETVVKIYDLFSTKYQDCADFQSMIRSLARSDELDFAIMGVVTRAFSYRPVEPLIVVGLLRRVLACELDEDDMEMHTRNMLQGIDMSRGCTHRLIKQLFFVYKDELVRSFTGEPALFVATVLRYRDSSFVASARDIISTSEDQTLLFSAFMYLISTGNCVVGDRSADYASLFFKHIGTPCRFVCLRYLSTALQSASNFYRNKIVGGGAPAALDFDPLVPALTEMAGQSIDEFSTEFLFQTVRAAAASGDAQRTRSWPAVYDFVSRLFLKIGEIASAPVNFLFDTYILLSIRLKRYNLKLIEEIINNDMCDLFAPCFLFLSILIQETAIPQQFVLNILGQDAVWKDTSYHLPLALVLVSAYKKGMVDSPRVMLVAARLGAYPAAVLLSRCALPGPAGDPQTNYIVNGTFDAQWFRDNFIDRKFCRLVLRRLARDTQVPGGLRDEIIGKNLRNIELELTFHSVTDYFGI